jgi:hypothetical protein
MANIWVIARNTIAHAMRMKLALIVIALLLVILPVLSVITTGDGTLLGKVQSFSSYGVSLVSMMLCLMAIAISCYSLNFELKYKQLYILVTKPVSRTEILLGKFVGLMVVNVLLLALFSSIIYAITVNMPTFSEAQADEIQRLETEFFAARAGLKPEPPIEEDRLQAMILERYNRLKDSDELPQGATVNEVFKIIRGQILMQAKSLGPGEDFVWRFNKVYPSDESETIFVRFKLTAVTSAGSDGIATQWVAGDLRKLEEGKRPDFPIYYSDVRRDPTRTARELQIPAGVVAQDGYLEIGMQNLHYNQVTIIPEDVEVLYRRGGFGMNFFRASLMILVRLTFLTAMGVSFSTWLSFPVAIFVAITIYFIGTVNGFIFDSLELLSTSMGLLYTFTIKPMLSLLPKFDGRFNPSPMIVSARMIEWWFVGLNILTTAVARSLVLIGLGILVFNRKEIARITV